MRILTINEKYQGGGTEVQTRREALLLRRKGHESLILTFDPDFPWGWIDEGSYNIAKAPDNLIMLLLHTVLPEQKLMKEIKKVIQDFKPDYVHINHATRHAVTVYKAVQGYPCLQTIRDYGYVCPNVVSVLPDYKICTGYTAPWKCIKCCFFKHPHKAVFLMQFVRFLLLDRLRHRSHIKFACPSQMLTDYCNRIGLDTKCINNPFDFTLLDELQPIKKDVFKTKVFLYYGEVAPTKGVNQLISAFSAFAKNKSDVQLHFAGSVLPSYKDEFLRRLRQEDAEKMQYLGKFPYHQMLEKLMTVHTVVVPSLWIENYPNTALEATACGCLVLGSERGGMKEIIRDERRIFHVLDQNDIIEKLEYAYAMDEKTYQETTARALAWIRENNAGNLYIERLMNRLKEC